MQFIKPINSKTDSHDFMFANIFNNILEKYVIEWDTASSRLATAMVRQFLYRNSENEEHKQLLEEADEDVRVATFDVIRLSTLVTSLERFAELANNDRTMLEDRGADFANLVMDQDLIHVIEDILTQWDERGHPGRAPES